jgi:hypothetical protein
MGCSSSKETKKNLTKKGSTTKSNNLNNTSERIPQYQTNISS